MYEILHKYSNSNVFSRGGLMKFRRQRYRRNLLVILFIVVAAIIVLFSQ